MKGKSASNLTAGDDVNARSTDGRTALLEAVVCNHTKCVVALLAPGADPSTSDNDKFLPLYVAAQNTNIAIAKALIRANANIDATFDRRPAAGTALSMAVFKGYKAMVKLLLDVGADTSKTAGDGHYPLTVAALEGHGEIATMLLDAGADVNALMKEGWTALLAATQKGSRDVVEILLERGANVNQPGPPLGRGVLHMAARHGFDEVLNVFIAAGADVDHADASRGTPLRTAAHSGHPKCAWALLRAGADVSARDSQGSSILHVAASQGHTDVVEVLLGAGAHADVNYEDNEHRTPLFSASAFADAKAVNLLLDAGAHVNQLDANGRTAIFAASDVKVVKALLDRGAEVKIINNYGATVLHNAGYRGACAGVICALFKAGADPTVTCNKGETAADWARGEGHEDAAKLLDLLAAKHRSTHST